MTFILNIKPPQIMTNRLTFELDLFKSSNRLEQKRSRKVILMGLEYLARINYGYLLEYSSKTPTLYKSGVVYKPERGTEIWKDIPNIIKAGWGDCEDLAAWRIAELRLAGERARPWLKWSEKSPKVKIYHAVLMRENGRVEDPSKALGMNGRPIIGRPVFIKPT